MVEISNSGIIDFLLKAVSIFLDRNNETSFLSYFLILLGVAIAIVIICAKLKISPVLGYLIAGALIGPYGFGLISYNNTTKHLAEFGVVFLLFSIGLEMTLERFKEMRKYIFGIGMVQFALVSLALYLICFALFRDYKISVILATSLALSSTAIVLKILVEKKKMFTTKGKISLAILLFQDLIAIPMFVLIPILMGNQGNHGFFKTVSILIFDSIIAFVIIFVVGRYFVKYLLKIVANSKSEEIFVATTLMIVFGSAFITEHFGLSLALGAFVAGMMIAETEYQHQVEAQIIPFKGLFLGLFFIFIGMHLNIKILLSNIDIILLFTIILLLTKTAILTLICYLFRFPWKKSLTIGLLLSQAGEFAFVLFDIAQEYNFMEQLNYQILLSVVGMSMALTPLLDVIVKKIPTSLGKSDAIPRFDVKHLAKRRLEEHVIIVGCGRVGSLIAEVLDSENIKYIIIDNNIDLINKYSNPSQTKAYYGDITSPDILRALKMDSCTAIVLALNEKELTINTLKLIKSFYPDKPVIMRASDDMDATELTKYATKLDYVVAETCETGLQLSKKVLRLSGVNMIESSKIATKFRKKYNIIR